MENKREIKRLLEKYLNRDLSVQETNELFDRLRTIHRPEELDAYFQSRWNIDRSTDAITDLIWEEVLDESHRQSALRRATIKTTRIRQLWQWGVAASVLLLVSLVWWNWDTGTEYSTFSTGFGETKNIVLNDGTSIILNANSELTWNEDWKEANTRYAWLQGEAYFEVAHIDLESGAVTSGSDTGRRMPFKVKTSDVVIDVLGTTFNVSDRRGETSVYLEEGSVKLDLLEQRSSQNSIEKKSTAKHEEEKLKPLKMVLMEPGESVRYSAETKSLTKNKSIKYTALTEWKDGTLVYQDVLFGDMLDHMEDIYGKEFLVQDTSLLTRNVNFGVPYENWETVKNLMETTLGIAITEDTDTKTKIKKRMK